MNHWLAKRRNQRIQWQKRASESKPGYTLQFQRCGDQSYTNEEEDRAIEAAEAVFAASGITAIEAYEAFRAMCAEEPHDAKASQTWIDAESAALNAAEENWARPSSSICMVL